MAVTNRVVWSDGLFIKPQHFQQQQRYLEHQINERALAVSDYLFGFSDLELNAEYLSFGRVGLWAGTPGVYPFCPSRGAWESGACAGRGAE